MYCSDTANPPNDGEIISNIRYKKEAFRFPQHMEDVKGVVKTRDAEVVFGSRRVWKIVWYTIKDKWRGDKNDKPISPEKKEIRL